VAKLANPIREPENPIKIAQVEIGLTYASLSSGNTVARICILNILLSSSSRCSMVEPGGFELQQRVSNPGTMM
jgi:hypothetical protein